MEFFEIPTWQDYQHYKDRDPPWIKLHFSLMTSPTWVMLDDASRVLAIACMLIASRNHGKVPANAEYVKRVCYLKSANFKPLLDIGFLTGASTMLADASALQAKATTEERRGETDMRFLSFWEAYPKKKNRADALKAFNSAKLNGSFELVMEALAAQTKSEEWTKEGGKYIPYPASWLRGRRWEDDTAAPTAKDWI